MNKGYIVSLLITQCCFVSAYDLKDDAQALQYCVNNKKAFIAIVWPIAQGKDHEIMRILNKYGSIKYRKDVYLKPDQAHHLLRTAHRMVHDMAQHIAWYFPQGAYQRPARIFVVNFKNADTAITAKHAVRRLYKLSYRPIHINDYHSETTELAHYFFGKTRSGDRFVAAGLTKNLQSPSLISRLYCFAQKCSMWLMNNNQSLA